MVMPLRVVSVVVILAQQCAGGGGNAAAAALHDPAPRTAFGRDVEALLLALRPALVLVPLAIMAGEARRVRPLRRERWVPAGRAAGGCGTCGARGHAGDAMFCRYCGNRLRPTTDARR
jgi:hypothetical protein